MKQDRARADFLLVIPAFAESHRLPHYLSDLVDTLRRRPYRTRVFIVDDGSTAQEQDRLRSTVAQFADSDNPAVVAELLKCNMGKGYAVRHGWSAGQPAQWLAFVDADGATPAYEVGRIFDTVFARGDERRCCFGSRVRMLGRTVERRWQRHVIGRVYATLVSLLVDEGVYDSQCGFKIIPAQAFDTIRDALRENRFAFDVELIVALVGAGYSIDETPIDWIDIAGSKVSVLKDSIRMTAALWQIHRRKKKGVYRAATRWVGAAAAAANDGSR